ncbi:hypothetical protein M2310_003247 [Rhizobium leguminosarum]|nr:hypothetical protein [Rhizobium leguminosarum]
MSALKWKTSRNNSPTPYRDWPISFLSEVGAALLRPTGTGGSDVPAGAVSAVVVMLQDRGDRIIPANIGELILADSRGHVFASPGRGTGEPLPPPVRRRAVSPGHAGRCVPIAGSGRLLQTLSARFPWRSSAPCFLPDQRVRYRGGRAVQACCHDRQTVLRRPTTHLNQSHATDSSL